MSMRWIHETQTPPNCVEESSDIDDSCSDDSYDSDLSLNNNNLHDENKNSTCKHIRYPSYFTIGKQRNKEKEKYIEHYKGIIPYIVWDPRLPALNPIYCNSKVKLLSRSGYQLSVDNYGKVRGVSRLSKHPDVFVIRSVTFGVIQIQNTETQLYIAFSAKGRLYGESNGNKDNTEWEQWNIGSYDAFRSRKYAELNWWIGIKKNSRPKLGPTTNWGQKAIQFTPLVQEIKKSL